MSTFNPGGPASNLTPSQVNTAISVNTRNQLNAIYPQKTGQTTSYATGDDGALQLGRPLSPGSFLVLDVVNQFGNTNRFTNDKGGSVYDGSDGSTANYAIDHLTGLGWYLNLHLGVNWATAVANAQLDTVGSYTNFFLPNRLQLQGIINDSVTSNVLNYAPFNTLSVSNQTLWTSTTIAFTTTNAYTLKINTSAMGGANKTGTDQFLSCRIHYS